MQFDSHTGGSGVNHYPVRVGMVSSTRIRPPCLGDIYLVPGTALRHTLGLNCVSFCGWGDQGDIAEKSAYPLQRAPINLEFAIRLAMAGLKHQIRMKMKRDDGGQGVGSSQDMNMAGQLGGAAALMEAKNWVLLVYWGHEAKTG
jgi:hypothetical protein